MKDGFARLLHWLYIVLEADGRPSSSEKPVGIDPYDDTSRHRRAIDACNIGSGLHVLGADADGVGLARDSPVAYGDVITAGGEINAGGIAQRDIIVPIAVVEESVKPDRGIVSSGFIAAERECAHGCIVDAGRAGAERVVASGRIVEAGAVREERPALGGVVAGITLVRRWG